MFEIVAMQLADHLDDNDLSIADFAKLVGRTHECVRLWLRGQRMPGTSDIVKIVEITDGAVEANDLHEACVDYQKSQGGLPVHTADLDIATDAVTEMIDG